MIAFGAAITKPEMYERAARRGIELAAEPGSEVISGPAAGTILQSYNALLERAVQLRELEALVLVHQDTEIVDHDFCDRARAALSQSDVGLVGCVGAVGVRSIAWWEGSVSAASFVHRHEDHGGGELPAFSWSSDDAPPYARNGEVDTLDGFLLVLSPWVVRHIRFDESLGAFHGYDLDFCLQVRAAGRKVITAPFRAVHHHALTPFDDPEPWIRAHIAVAEKWDGRIARVGTSAGDWSERAYRAQAMRDVARLVDHGNVQLHEARVRRLEAAIAEARGSVSWRVTAPLRWGQRVVHARRAHPTDRSVVVQPPEVPKR